MASNSGNKAPRYLVEVGKWALVLWLLWPVQQAAQGPIDFVRVAAGVVLFVIFAGKLLYDTTFFRNRHARDSDAGKDLLSMLGIVAGIALLVLVLVFFAALLVMNLLRNVRF